MMSIFRRVGVTTNKIPTTTPTTRMQRLIDHRLQLSPSSVHNHSNDMQIRFISTKQDANAQSCFLQKFRVFKTFSDCLFENHRVGLEKKMNAHRDDMENKINDHNSDVKNKLIDHQSAVENQLLSQKLVLVNQLNQHNEKLLEMKNNYELLLSRERTSDRTEHTNKDTGKNGGRKTDETKTTMDHLLNIAPYISLISIFGFFMGYFYFNYRDDRDMYRVTKSEIQRKINQQRSDNSNNSGDDFSRFSDAHQILCDYKNLRSKFRFNGPNVLSHKDEISFNKHTKENHLINILQLTNMSMKAVDDVLFFELMTLKSKKDDPTMALLSAYVDENSDVNKYCDTKESLLELIADAAAKEDAKHILENVLKILPLFNKDEDKQKIIEVVWNVFDEKVDKQRMKAILKLMKDLVGGGLKEDILKKLEYFVKLPTTTNDVKRMLLDKKHEIFFGIVKDEEDQEILKYCVKALSLLPSTNTVVNSKPKPSGQSSVQPSSQPSVQPKVVPSGQPSSQPSCQPSSVPTEQPSMQPSSQPSDQPSGQPKPAIDFVNDLIASNSPTDKNTKIVDHLHSLLQEEHYETLKSAAVLSSRNSLCRLFHIFSADKNANDILKQLLRKVINGNVPECSKQPMKDLLFALVQKNVNRDKIVVINHWIAKLIDSKSSHEKHCIGLAIVSELLNSFASNGKDNVQLGEFERIQIVLIADLLKRLAMFDFSTKVSIFNKNNAYKGLMNPNKAPYTESEETIPNTKLEGTNISVKDFGTINRKALTNKGLIKDKLLQSGDLSDIDDQYDKYYGPVLFDFTLKEDNGNKKRITFPSIEQVKITLPDGTSSSYERLPTLIANDTDVSKAYLRGRDVVMYDILLRNDRTKLDILNQATLKNRVFIRRSILGYYAHEYGFFRYLKMSLTTTELLSMFGK